MTPQEQKLLLTNKLISDIETVNNFAKDIEYLDNQITITIDPVARISGTKRILSMSAQFEKMCSDIVKLVEELITARRACGDPPEMFLYRIRKRHIEQNAKLKA